MSCILCELVRGEAEASYVYRDELVAAFMDIRPVTPGHLLVVPNAHVPWLGDMGVETADHLFRVGIRMTEALRRSELRGEGINLLLSDGAAAGQELAHTHLHVFPRFPGDGVEMEAAAWSRPPPTREEFDDQAFRIRLSLNLRRA